MAPVCHIEARNSTKKTPTSIIPGDEARRHREVNRTPQRAIINSLEDVLVQLARGVALVREAQLDEGVGQALHADADGAVAHVAVLGLLDLRATISGHRRAVDA